MTSSKLLFLLCLSCIFGIAVESWIIVPEILLWAFLLAGALFAVSFLIAKKDVLMVIGFCLLIAVVAVARVQITQFTIASDALTKLEGKGTVTLTGIITDAPDVRDTSQKITLKVGSSLVLVTIDKYPVYHYLDTVRVVGKLEAPFEAPDFDYKEYLLKDGIYSVMSFPKVALVSSSHHYDLFSYCYQNIINAKNALFQSMDALFVPPQRLLLQGIMFGDNKNMTEDLQNKLQNTGLRFLTAISGVHIVIISAVLITLLLSLGFWRSQAFFLSIFCIWGYIFMTGCSAAGVRAGIMGSIFLVAQALGRQNASARMVALAGAVMLLQNPLLLRYDIGFQLSFMAALGIVYAKPFISGLLTRLFHNHARELTDILAVTFAAQVFVMPLMVYSFGTVTFVSPLTSVLILPVMPWILVLGFLSSFLGIFSHLVGWIIAIPCVILLDYFLKVMDIFSLPWASKTVSEVPLLWLAFCYALMIFATYIFYRKYQDTFSY